MMIKNGHIKATTLVETLTALLLIAIAFGIGTMVYAQVNQSNPIREQSATYSIVQSVLEESIQFADFKNSKKEINGLIVEKEVKTYGDFNHLYHIKVSAILNEKEIMSLEKLVHYEKDNH